MAFPIWGYIGGGALLLGALGGWTVRDWKADSDQLDAIEKAQKEERRLRDQLQLQAQEYEQEKADAQPQADIRRTEIRTIYRDRVVSADCAVPDDARGVLNRAIDDANARAAGKPAPSMPRPSRTPGPPNGP